MYSDLDQATEGPRASTVSQLALIESMAKWPEMID